MANRTPGVNQLLQNAGCSRDDVQEVADRYVDFFDKSKGASEEERKVNYEKVVNAYYDLATDFYEYGWGQSFHFACPYNGEDYAKAIMRHEHMLPLRMQVSPGDTVLDCGCGVGGPAREIARFSGCRVVGLNNNAYQVQRATMHTKAQKLSDRVTFVKGNFMAIPAEANTFDGVYAIEATCHAPNPADVYGEIFRVLKPGKIFAAYEWCMTSKYDPTDPQHQSIKLGIEEGDGIPNLSTIEMCVKALRSVGFEVLENRDLASEGDAPWYTPLDNSWSLRNFRNTRTGRWFTSKFVSALEMLRIAPRGTGKTHDFLIKAAENLVAGGQQEIFTPMFFFVARKPE